MSERICLNADLGELPGDEGRRLDRAMLALVTRCNVACGGHAGDAGTMVATIEAAREAGVRIGAHPSYPDRATFGRTRNGMPLEALRVSLLSQVRALQAEARAIGASVDHIKPHGSLYNDAARDGDLARLVVDLCTETGIGELLGPPDSALQQAAEQAGLRFVPEGFADRLYEADGTLTPRSVPGAVIEDGDKQLRQSLGIVRDGEVFARTGERVPLQVATICLHGDTPGAADNAAALRAGLEAHGIIVQP